MPDNRCIDPDQIVALGHLIAKDIYCNADTYEKSYYISLFYQIYTSMIQFRIAENFPCPNTCTKYD